MGWIIYRLGKGTQIGKTGVMIRDMKVKRWTKVSLGLVVVIYLFLAGYRLRELPGEWFGDISILHEEVLDILKNPLDWKYNLSAGPLYHHLVAGFAYIFGTTYEV